MTSVEVPINLEAIRAMFHYLSAATPILRTGDAAFVFGRADARLGETVAELYDRGLIDWAVVTGGRGKDSGLLPRAEAEYVVDVAAASGMPRRLLYAEVNAKNGGDNCRNGLDVLAGTDLAPEMLIVVAHSISVRRLTMMLIGEINARGLNISVQSVGDGYYFNPASPTDALEACQEIIRMADWPSKYGYAENLDLDPELVAYARQLEPLLKAAIKAHAAAL